MWVAGRPGAGAGGALTLQDAAGTLLWPRGLGAQDGPDRLIKDGLQASLGEGRALQVFYRVWGLGRGKRAGAKVRGRPWAETSPKPHTVPGRGVG